MEWDRYVQQIRRVYPELEVRTCTRKLQGENNDVLIVNEAFVFRFPKYEQGIGQLVAETKLLEFLQGKVTLPIPQPAYQHLGAGKVGEVFVGYRMLEGVPLQVDWVTKRQGADGRKRVAQQLALFLQELHGVSVTELQGLPVEMGPFSVEQWRAEWADLFARIEEKLFHHMRQDARAWTAQHFTAYLHDPHNFDFQPVLLHGDFGPSNLLYDATTRSISGIIDFGLAGLGDPAVDVANLIRYGEGFMQQAAEVYPRIAELLPRAKFYVGTFALQQALFGTENGDDAAFREGIAAYT